MDEHEKFLEERSERISGYRRDRELLRTSDAFVRLTIAAKYSYNFDWLGRPVIQYPQDIVALQEIVWRTRPDLIIETGVARGGSLILHASLLALLDYCDAIADRKTLDPAKPNRTVMGIDIEIRSHNRAAIVNHPLSSRIKLVQGSSIDPSVVAIARKAASEAKCVLVCLDSNHSHDHVLAELRAYAPMVSRGSYCIVFDTIVESLPNGLIGERHWGPGNSPLSAARAFLTELTSAPMAALDGLPLTFEPDGNVEGKLLITVAPGGFLRRTTSNAHES